MRIFSRLALVVIASGVVLALAVGAMAVPARLLDDAGSGDPGPISLRPLAQRSYMYAADGSVLAVLREEQNRQSVPLDTDPAARHLGDPGRRGRRLLGPRRLRRPGHAPGVPGQRRAGRHLAGWLDDHPAADQARRPGQRADARPQDRRDRAGVATREDDEQGGDPRPLRQHRLLRQPRVRDPGRRRDLLRRQRPRPQPGAGRFARGAHPEPGLLQPHPVSGAGGRAARRRPRAPGRRGCADRSRGRGMEAGHADPDRRAQRVAAGQRLLRIGRWSSSSWPTSGWAAPRRSASTPCTSAGSRSTRPTRPQAQAQAQAARDQNLPLVNGVFAAGTDPAAANRASALPPSCRVDPKTGAVPYMVAGPGFQNYKYNLVTQNKRQTGSSFKTFVLATAMEQRLLARRPDRRDRAVPVQQPDGEPDPYPAENFGGSTRGVGTLTTQTLGSVNCAYMRLGLVVGLNNVVNMAQRLGVHSTAADGLAANQSLPLGSAGVTPLDMASAYATLANDGVYNAPYFIEKVEDRNGKVIFQHEPAPKPVISPQTARLVTEILRQNVTSGTGTAAAPRHRSAGGGQDRHAHRAPTTLGSWGTRRSWRLRCGSGGSVRSSPSGWVVPASPAVRIRPGSGVTSCGPGTPDVPSSSSPPSTRTRGPDAGGAGRCRPVARQPPPGQPGGPPPGQPPGRPGAGRPGR